MHDGAVAGPELQGFSDVQPDRQHQADGSVDHQRRRDGSTAADPAVRQGEVTDQGPPELTARTGTELGRGHENSIRVNCQRVAPPCSYLRDRAGRGTGGLADYLLFAGQWQRKCADQCTLRCDHRRPTDDHGTHVRRRPDPARCVPERDEAVERDCAGGDPAEDHRLEKQKRRAAHRQAGRQQYQRSGVEAAGAQWNHGGFVDLERAGRRDCDQSDQPERDLPRRDRRRYLENHRRGRRLDPAARPSGDAGDRRAECYRDRSEQHRHDLCGLFLIF